MPDAQPWTAANVRAALMRMVSRDPRFRGTRPVPYGQKIATLPPLQFIASTPSGEFLVTIERVNEDA